MISIIIPVYNGEKYILRCYDSLVNQSLHDWEAIFINDGSTDRSLVFLKQLEQKDSRIKVFDKKNEGVAVAREYGINLSSYEIITFLDVDDTLTRNALETFVTHLKSGTNDIVISGINIVSEAGYLINTISYKAKSYNGAKIVELLSCGKIRWQLWAKAFRKKLFYNVVTPSGIKTGEDMAVCFQAVLNADKVEVLNECLYDYIQVETSVTHRKNVDVTLDAFKSLELIVDLARAKISSEYIDCLYLLISSTSLRMGVSPKNDIIKKNLNYHFKFRLLKRLGFVKALNLIIARYFRINIAQCI